MKVLYAPARQRVPSKAFEWSNGTYSLLLDATLELELTLDEDFAELLDVSAGSTSLLLLDFALLDDIPADVPGSPFLLLLDTLVELELDFGVTLDEDFALLLETLVSHSLDCGVTSSMLLDDSSSRGAKLLSSSPHATKNANTAPTANNLANFMFLPQIISLKYNQNALAYCKKCNVNKLFRLILGAKSVLYVDRDLNNVKCEV